jgi:beta-mannanase
MVGIDAYMADLSIGKGYRRLVALGKPFWLTEFGPFKGSDVIHDYDYTRLIRKIRRRYPMTVAFQCWNNDWSMIAQQNARLLLEDPWVITQEDLDWRR